MKTTRFFANLLVAVLMIGVLAGCDSNREPYEAAQALFDEGKYEEAIIAFEDLGEYEDSAVKAVQAEGNLRILDIYKENESVTFDNKAGLYIEVEAYSEPNPLHNLVMVKSSNPLINVNEDISMSIANRLYILDAKTHEKIDFETYLGNNYSLILRTEEAASSASVEYYSSLYFLKEIPVEYILVCFEGITSKEIAKLEPLFFIVYVGEDGMEVVTKTPLEMDSSFSR